MCTLEICISASTEATEMYHLSNFSFLRAQSIGTVFDYPKGIFYGVFFYQKCKNTKIFQIHQVQNK